MRIVLAQLALDSDVARNLEQALTQLRAAKRDDADLVLFPELCFSPFFPQYSGRNAAKYVQTLDSSALRAFQATCAELQLVAVPNVYLRDDAQQFDSSLIVERDGSVLSQSRMVHIAQLPGFYERDYYAPSQDGFPVANSSAGRIGVVVCFDRHFPESIRTVALRGAEIVLIPTANTINEPLDVFECELRAAAFQNGVFIAMCNRVGKEDATIFCGDSIVIGPDGEVVAKASREAELLVVNVDLSRVSRVQSSRPYLALRRPDAYYCGPRVQDLK